MTISIPESLAASHRQDIEGTVKTFEDLARYRRILLETKPELIIECGTYSGGSAAWFSRFAPVVTVDVDDTQIEEKHMKRWNDRVRFVHGSSVSNKVIARVHDIAWRRRCFLTLDSDHSYRHVYNEMLAYSELVPVGGFMVVEDTLLRWMDDTTTYVGNPLDAIERYLSNSDEWANDETIEGMFAQSQHLGGWLRRIK